MAEREKVIRGLECCALGSLSNCEGCPYCENVYQCSVCGEEWDILVGTPKQNSYHYCPNCGAKMDVEPPKEEDDG